MQQREPLTISQSARLASLVAQFRRGIERQRRYDAELEAALERLARRGIIRKIIQEHDR
jgi:hypothetical protein